MLEARIRRRARRAHLDLSPDIAARLADYLALLEFWNRKINLTSLTDADEAVDRLVLEPALAARQLGHQVTALLDIGSGGGSPALPLKICVPRLRVTMVEAKTRKAAFLREAVRHLCLLDCEVETRRYEELLTRPDLIESLDVVTVRAVRVDARSMLKLGTFVRSGGELWMFTSGTAPDHAAPPLVIVADDPLVEARGSRLRRFRKVPA